MRQKVLVAMSGGVDSSVTAFLLKSQGYDCVGVTMCLGIKAEEEHVKCCGPTAVEDARRVCDRLTMPHYVFNYAREMEQKVIARFIGEYLKGRTPNPCVDCNRHLKFGSLLQIAEEMGFDFLATGHYAAIERIGDNVYLKKPKDRKKDQTYFLYPIPQEGLKSVLFPLAVLTKEEVRGIALKASLPVAGKKESQDICFVTQKNYQAFLSERVPEMKPGVIVDTRGNILGMHRGIVFYTIGQRSGLRISHATPLYVIAKDAAENRIIVGDKEQLKGTGLIAGNINRLVETWPDDVKAKIRYRKKEVSCKVAFEGESVRVIFSEEQEAIAPGQSVVFYADDCVLGGGEIEEVLHGTY
jgi:tRNA-uridine 2-sulfurtransferase